MDLLRNWLLPAVVTAPNAVITGLVLLNGPETGGAVASAGLLLAFLLELGALGRRRREPLWALAGTVAAALLGDLTAPEYFVALGTPVALYSVAVRCGGRVTALAAVTALGGVRLPHLVHGGAAASLVTGLAVTAVVYAACAGAGQARRQWLSGRWAAAGRLARAEESRRQAADTERHRLARELHDVSAHHLTSVVVTVDAARRLGASRPELLDEALAFAGRTGRETLTALRRLAAVMRDTGAPDPRPMSGRIQDLVAGFSRLGRPIAVELPDDLAGPAAEAAFGIVRESLTNALRHAPGTPVHVRIRRDADPTGPGGTDGSEPEEGSTLVLTVENGAPRAAAERPATGLGSGNGVTGMRERAAAVGGALTAGPAGDGGWRVTARLPDSTGPRPPARPSRRPDLLRTQRLTDVSLVFTAVAFPLYVSLSTVADGVSAAGPADGVVLALLLAAHALPLLWRRRAPWTAVGAMAVTAWLLPAACAADLLPPDWVGLLPVAGVAEAMAVYAAAAYGRGAVQAFGAVLVATAGLTGALTAAAVVDGVLVLPRDEPGAVRETVSLLLWMTVPPLLAMWGTGLAVRGRRLRVVTREEEAFTGSVRQAAEEAAAERRRIAVELREKVLERTTRMVERADGGAPDEVAAEARAALAAMRELLRSLRGTAEQGPGARHAPQPSAAELAGLCRTWRGAGRKVTLHGLPRAADGLPAAVSLTAYRVVEAALDAGDTGPGRVTLRRRRGRLHLTVTGVPLAAAGPVAERLRIQVEAGEGELVVDRAGTLRVSLPAGDVPHRAPAEEVPSSPYA